MAPEIYTGEDYGEPSDIWSLGVSFYEVFSVDDPDQHPIGDDGKYIPLKKISAQLQNLLKKMLIANPKKRITIP